MTNATKTLAIVFAGSVLLAVAASWEGGASSSAAFEEELLAVDTSSVRAVEIERPNAPPIRLTRSENQWSVSPNDETSYPASSETVQRLLNDLTTLQVAAVPTRQADKHPRYDVDSTGTLVRMFGADGEPLGGLIVGRTRVRQPQGQANQRPMQRMQRRRGTEVSYVRVPDRPDVYSVERGLQSVVNRDVEAWRDKVIWSVDRSQIQRIDFSFPADSSFQMQRVTVGDTATAGTGEAWVSSGDTLATTEVSSLLQTLSSPRADGFVNDATPESIEDPLYQVRLHLADGSTRSLRIRQGDSEDLYVAAAENFPYVVEIRRSRWDDKVLNGRQALRRDE